MDLRIYRVYICYLLTTFLLAAFVYSLISTNLQNTRKLDRLREEVDDIAHIILQAPYNGKTESKYLSDLIDSFIKKRLAGIWDDLYSIKKQLKSKDFGAAQATGMDSKTFVEKIEERVNYASDKLGAIILDVKAEPICKNHILKWLGIEFNTNLPIFMLQSSMEPGNCFGFKNHRADVYIKMPQEILIDQVLLQHITKQQSPTEDTSSAPKDFQVFGLDNKREFPLGCFTYDNHQPIQYFNVRSTKRFQILVIKFMSNHGHPSYTCVYRVAVYGKL